MRRAIILVVGMLLAAAETACSRRPSRRRPQNQRRNRQPRSRLPRQRRSLPARRRRPAPRRRRQRQPKERPRPKRKWRGGIRLSPLWAATKRRPKPTRICLPAKQGCKSPRCAWTALCGAQWHDCRGDQPAIAHVFLAGRRPVVRRTGGKDCHGWCVVPRNWQGRIWKARGAASK